MPVYDYTYHTWKGVRRGPLFRWAAIPKFAYMEFLRKRFFVWLLTLGCFQFILRLAYIYLLVNQEFLKLLRIPAGSIPPINAFFFKNMIDLQLIFCFLLAFQLGAGLISRDLQHNATVLYMSKPISKWEYFLGKFATLFCPIMFLTWFQAALLFGIQTVVAPEHSEWHLYFWSRYAWIFPALTAYSAVVSATLCLIILAASSLTKNPRYAATSLAVYIIGSGIVARIVSDMLKSDRFFALSPFMSGVDLGYYLFGMGERAEIPSQAVAWIGLAGVCLLSAVILRLRLDSAARFGR